MQNFSEKSAFEGYFGELIGRGWHFMPVDIEQRRVAMYISQI